MVFLVVVGFLVVAVISAGVGTLLTRPAPAPQDPSAVSAVEVPRPGGDEVVVDGGAQNNPFGHSQHSEDMTEHLALTYVLGMARQKVVTDVVRTRYEMTPERIAWVGEVVEAQPEFESRGALLAILDRWEDQDFSRVVDDHNIVWDLLDGEIGKGQRAATETEEAAFIAYYFGD